MNIAIIEDHKLFLKSLKALIETEKNFMVKFEAYNGKEFIKQLSNFSEENLPDIAIIDLNMPIMNGLETLDWLKKNYPSIKCIILTMSYTRENIIKSIKLGANAILNKDIEANELINAIKKVYTDGEYYTSRITQTMIEAIQNKIDISDNEAKISSLTERDKQIIKLICKEYTSYEISDEVDIAVRTIEGNIRNILQKLNVKSRVGIALFAERNNLLK